MPRLTPKRFVRIWNGSHSLTEVTTRIYRETGLVFTANFVLAMAITLRTFGCELREITRPDLVYSDPDQ